MGFEKLAIALVPLLTIALGACDSATSAGDAGASDTGAQGAVGWCYLVGAEAGKCVQTIVFASEVPQVPLWIACPGAAIDGGADGGEPPPFVSALAVANGECLPAALPVDPSGKTSCLLVEESAVDAGVSSCGAIAGLSTPSAATLAAIHAHAPETATALLCQIDQLSASADGSCASP